MSGRNKTYVAQEETLLEVRDKIDNIRAITNNNFNLINSTLDSDNPVPLDTIILQAVVGNIFEYATAGDYILQIPAIVSKIKVTACGAGGGGGGGGLTTSAGGGGGGEAIVDAEYAVMPQSQLHIKVGAGGQGGATGLNNGEAGNPTVIGDLVTLRGGLGGTSVSQSAGLGAQAIGNGGAGGNGLYIPKGTEISGMSNAGTKGLVGNGGAGITPQGNTTGNYSNGATSGGGGGGSLGNGGKGKNGNGGGTVPTKGGGGGGGGGGYIASQNKSTAGTAGAPGYVKITWGY